MQHERLGKIIVTVKMNLYNKSITCIIAFVVTFENGVFLLMEDLRLQPTAIVVYLHFKLSHPTTVPDYVWDIYFLHRI